ncbi:hypothetical protein ACA910_018372 [Epithemia clementina (nom. ined.)]
MCRLEPVVVKSVAEPDSAARTTNNNTNNNNTTTTTTTTTRAVAAADDLADDELWLKTFDLNVFRADMQALGKELEAAQGLDDVKHLHKMIGWSNGCALVGWLTLGLCRFNVVAILGLSLYTFSRWTMIAHHTCHGGYDKCCHPQGAKNKGRWSRFQFALGNRWRRLFDWLDWMLPEAWNVEHNNRHHYNLSETTDPDLVEQNLHFVRQLNVSVPFKYGLVAFFMVTWKWFYYSPNTFKELKLAHLRRFGQPLPKSSSSNNGGEEVVVNPDEPVTFKDCLLNNHGFYALSELLWSVLGPYFLCHFVVAPLPWLLIGHWLPHTTAWTMYSHALINVICAEWLTNVHGFIAVVTNHAGSDLYRFQQPCRPFSGSFYLRQVLASVDYDYGSDGVDFWHGWLNYQIEHHLFPNLSMYRYRQAAPRVKEICRRHQVPYIQESVWIRLQKTVAIMVGTSHMRWFPTYYETKFLENDALAILSSSTTTTTTTSTLSAAATSTAAVAATNHAHSNSTLNKTTKTM